VGGCDNLGIIAVQCNSVSYTCCRPCVGCRWGADG